MRNRLPTFRQYFGRSDEVERKRKSNEIRSTYWERHASGNKKGTGNLYSTLSDENLEKRKIFGFIFGQNMSIISNFLLKIEGLESQTIWNSMDTAIQSSVYVSSPEFAGYLTKRGFHVRPLYVHPTSVLFLCIIYDSGGNYGRRNGWLYMALKLFTWTRNQLQKIQPAWLSQKHRSVELNSLFCSSY